MTKQGRVYLIGAGPGDPDLLTIRALRMLQEADVVVYDRLVSDEILSLIPEDAKRVFAGKASSHHALPQEQINELLVRYALEGGIVARLKGGDPLIFGRGSEEAAHCAEFGIKVDYAPGITAAQGVAMSTGVPLTHRGLATGVRYVTGHRQAGGTLDLDWKSLASQDTTLVVYMGVANIGQIAMRLIAAGLSEQTPVMAIERATSQTERRLFCRLGTVSPQVHKAGLKPPTLFIIGKVVTLSSEWTQDNIAALLEKATAEVANA